MEESVWETWSIEQAQEFQAKPLCVDWSPMWGF